MSQNEENSEKKVTKASKNKETKNAKTNKTTKTKKAMTNKKTTKAKKETKTTNKNKKSKNSKKEMAIKIGFVILGVILIVVAINLYKFFVSGNQQIKINTSSKAYANSDMYVSVVAQKDNTDLETKTKIKLKDSKGKNVKGTKVSYEGNEAKISIPDVEGGQYTLEAKVSSKEGKDTVKKDIYISKGNEENSIITLDKGIYKPGDTVNYRAMIINRKDDSPVVEDVNVSIYDGNENKVYNENTKTSDYGIVSGSFQLANEVNSGTYKVITKTESSETTKEFKVNPYVTPKYEVKVNYDKDNYLVGDTAKININAKYFFGEPVAHAKVKVNVSEANGASVTLDKEESNSKQNTSNNNTNNTSSNTTNSNVNNTSSNTTNSNENNNSEQTETGKYEELETDDQGNATLEYSITKATSYNVNVEAVDSSNYYVESSNTFTAGTDIFEIDLLPEYGNLVSGNKNNVYVFTHKADGTPVKSYVTVVSDGYNKQVATDDNGIGQFSIDVANSGTYSNNNSSYSSNKYNTDYQNNVYSKQFTITAENTEKQKVEKKKSLNIEKRNILLSTDKVKYEQGEDIKLNIQSISTNNQNIYFFKNNRLLKMLNTEMKETTVNLGDEYGLIDIYIPEAQGNYSSSNNLNNTKFYKRTVFIKPKKQLNISVNTDKEEYKPGDKISISIDTKDENNNSVDAALLVSMLDNSVLELANNDLSIDNIKLALQNIQFSDDLDAATLYSCIIDDKSEQSMMALLLKQNATNPDISQTIANNTNEKESALSTTITWGIVFVVITLIIASLKVKNFKKFLKHVVNFFIFEVWLFCIIVGIMYNLPRSSSFTWVHLIILVSLGLAAYIGVIARYSEKIFRTSIALVISYGLIFLSNYIYIFNLDYETRKSLPSTILAIISVIFLLCVIATAISKRKKSEWYDALRPIMRTIIYIIRFAIILVLSYFLTVMIANTFSIFSDATLPIVLLITIIYLFDLLINAIINKGFYEKMKKYVKSKFKSKEDVVFFVVSCLAIIGFVALISLGIMVFRNASDVAGGNGMAGGYTFDSKLNSGSSYKGSTGSSSSSSHGSGLQSPGSVTGGTSRWYHT